MSREKRKFYSEDSGWLICLSHLFVLVVELQILLNSVAHHVHMHDCTCVISPDGRAHKRRRTADAVDIEDRLESLITRVGEKVFITGYPLFTRSASIIKFPDDTSQGKSIIDCSQYNQ